MSQYTKRTSFLHASKYQKKLVLFILFPVFALCIFICVMQSIFIKEMVNVVLFKPSPDIIRILFKSSTFVFFMLWAFFLFVIIWALVVSENLIGAFERVIKDMDKVIASKGKMKLRVRQKDSIAKELVKRINILIDGFAEND